MVRLHGLVSDVVNDLQETSGEQLNEWNKGNEILVIAMLHKLDCGIDCSSRTPWGPRQVAAAQSDDGKGGERSPKKASQGRPTHQFTIVLTRTYTSKRREMVTDVSLILMYRVGTDVTSALEMRAHRPDRPDRATVAHCGKWHRGPTITEPRPDKMTQPIFFQYSILSLSCWERTLGPR